MKRLERFDRSRDWAVVILLSATLIFSLVDRVALSLMLDPIKASLGISDAQFGLLNGIAFGLFYACMGLPMGWLVDRWSRKGTMLIGVAVWSFATAICGFASTFTALLLARIFVGAGEAGLAPASYGILHSRFVDRGLGLAISIFQIGGTIGSGIGLIVTGMTYSFFEHGGASNVPYIGHFAAWQLTFIAIALPGAFFLILLSFIRDQPQRSQEKLAENDRISLLEALRADRENIATLYLGMAGIWITTYALLSWLPAAFAREYHISPRDAGFFYGSLVTVVCPVGMILGGVVSDHLLRKIDCPIQIIIALLVTVVAIPLVVMLVWFDSFRSALIIAGLLHIFLSAPVGIVPALIQHQAPASVRGQLSALYIMTVTFMGAGLGPTLVGVISSCLPQSATTLRTAIVAVCVPALIIASVLLSWRVGFLRKSDGLMLPATDDFRV